MSALKVSSFHVIGLIVIAIPDFRNFWGFVIPEIPEFFGRKFRKF